MISLEPKRGSSRRNLAKGLARRKLRIGCADSRRGSPRSRRSNKKEGNRKGQEEEGLQEAEG